jgi:hypothetical protein
VPYEFLKKIAATYRCKGSTLLDIQAVLEEWYPFIPGSKVNFCSPHRYDERYITREECVNEFKVQKHVTTEEYEEWMNSHGRSLAENYDKEHPEESRPINYAESKQREVVSELNKLRFLYKRCYYVQVIRAIAQYHYKLKLDEIRGTLGNRLLAYSSCDIGHRRENYSISRNIRLLLYSNFGYGPSSALYLILYYKEVPIVPFSYYVNFYFAKASDLCRCTREYYPRAESWDVVFDFMAEVLNLEKTNDEEFIEKWIVKEIDSMMAGMEAIMTHPEAFFDRWAAISSPANTNPYKSIRALNGKELELYACYPKEMLLDFQAEKISGAFDLLGALEKLEGFDAGIKKHIGRIRQMAKEFHPRIETGIKAVEGDLKRLDNDIEGKREELNTVKARLEDEKKRITTECGKAIEGITDRNVRNSVWDNRYSELTVKGSAFYALQELVTRKENDFLSLYNDRLNRNKFMERLVEFERAIKEEKGCELVKT